MSTPAFNDYDQVAYPSMAHPHTFAENLATKGFLRGLTVAPPDRCRVLELGCGDGFNLAAMAVVHPGARYTGIDYSAHAISRGRGLLADLGLTQIRLEAADIRTLDSGLGEFDYIIAHGVYSWVPVDVRDAVLAVISRHLAPNGVAFVSYLALPGAYMRETVRTIMRFHTRTVPDPKERTLQAKAVLQTITRATTETSHYTNWLTAELALIEAHADEGLFHDELSEISAPLLFTDFLEHASRHHLHFLCEAEYLRPLAQNLTPDARERLRPLENNRVLLEQYLDFIEGRRFRQTLLCRAGLGAQLVNERLETLHLGLRAKSTTAETSLTGPEPIEFKMPKKAVLRAQSPLEKAVLLELAEIPGATRSYPVLLVAVRVRFAQAGIPLPADFETALRSYLISSSVPGLVELHWGEPVYTWTPPARPRANPLARWLLAHDAPSVVSLSGQFVEIKGALGRFLLSLLDGTRDRAALVADIRTFLANAHAAAKNAGEPPPSLPPPDLADLPQQLERSLQGLSEMGLIFRDSKAT